MTNDPASYTPAHAPAPSRVVAEPFGSALETVRPLDELRKVNVNIHPSSLTENREDDDGNSSSGRTSSTSAFSDPHRLRLRALQMLRDRRVDNPDDLVDSTTAPQAIIGACEWWDAKRDAQPGLLVWKIRQGGVPEKDAPVSKASQARDVFDRYVAAHPVGSRLCSHIALAARKWPDDEEACSGQMMVVEASYPALEFECGACGFVASLTPRAMRSVI